MSPDTRTGFIAATAAFTAWGFFPLYFALLRDVPSFEIIGHRIIWATPALAVIVTFRKRWGDVKSAILNRKTLATLAATGGIIGFNWFIYVYAMTSNAVLSASLGYYIGPLITVALGVVVLKEPLRLPQKIALGLAGLGVLNQVVVVGEIPLIALTLAVTFSLYGLLRKTLAVGPMTGLFVETCLLTPVCLAAVLWIESTGAGHLFASPKITTLLLLAGLVSALPLLLFAIGAQRLRLSTIGLIQYLAPTLVFLCGIYLGEPFTPALGLTFALIWTGLAVFSVDAWRKERGGGVGGAR
ncbi:MAG: EamA family transporter RarD [Pseudomonadota bacterium]